MSCCADSVSARKRFEDEVPEPAPDYLRELNEAYQHFFFHYTQRLCWWWRPRTSTLAADDAALEDLISRSVEWGAEPSTTSRGPESAFPLLTFDFDYLS
jgi:hypothetical protein